MSTITVQTRAGDEAATYSQVCSGCVAGRTPELISLMKRSSLWPTSEVSKRYMKYQGGAAHLRGGTCDLLMQTPEQINRSMREASSLAHVMAHCDVETQPGLAYEISATIASWALSSPSSVYVGQLIPPASFYNRSISVSNACVGCIKAARDLCDELSRCIGARTTPRMLIQAESVRILICSSRDGGNLTVDIDVPYENISGYCSAYVTCNVPLGVCVALSALLSSIVRTQLVSYTPTINDLVLSSGPPMEDAGRHISIWPIDRAFGSIWHLEAAIISCESVQSLIVCVPTLKLDKATSSFLLQTLCAGSSFNAIGLSCHKGVAPGPIELMATSSDMVALHCEAAIEEDELSIRIVAHTGVDAQIDPPASPEYQPTSH